jgi:hypothetical protein
MSLQEYRDLVAKRGVAINTGAGFYIEFVVNDEVKGGFR